MNLMGFKKPLLWAPLVIVAVVGCGDRSEDRTGAATAESSSIAFPTANPADPAASASASRVVETEAQMDTEDARSYNTRKQSMASYSGCMAQARQADAGPVRKKIEEACGRLPSAPH